MRRAILTMVVTALEKGCFLLHWIPGWQCRLTEWSFKLDQKYNLGQWRGQP